MPGAPSPSLGWLGLTVYFALFERTRGTSKGGRTVATCATTPTNRRASGAEPARGGCGIQTAADRLPSVGQPFPRSGPLRAGLDRPLEALKASLRDAPQAAVYPYVLSTIDRQPDGTVIHTGGSPNFQGGVITLCACKHRMRTAPRVHDGGGVWIAGVTNAGVIPGQGRHLFYLMYVAQRFASHADIWASLPPMVRDAKSASRSVFGDIYEPTSPTLHGEDRYDANNYRQPRPGHVHLGGEPPNWHKDINYPPTGARRPALLLGEPNLSFLWTRPVIGLYESRRPLPRTIAVSESLSDFLDRLRS